MSAKNAAYHLGRGSAELFIGFSAFLHRQAVASEVERLFFITREGVFFKRVFETLFGEQFGSTSIRTGLLRASRMSVFPPSIVNESGLYLKDIFRLYPNHSPSSLLTSLGLTPSEYESLAQSYGLKMNAIVHSAAEKRHLEAFVADARFLDLALPELIRKRSTAMRYFQAEFEGLKKIGLVEIGWRGTAQAAIGRLFPGLHFVGMYLGLAEDRNLLGANCERHAYGPNQNHSSEYLDLLHAVNVLEFACLSECGSTVGYEDGAGGHVSPRVEIDPLENRRIREFSQPFQEGVLAVAGETKIGELWQWYDSGQLRPLALSKWRNLIKRPNPDLVKAYFSLRSNERFGLGEISSQAIVPTISELVASFVSSRHRHQTIRFLVYTQWVEGMGCRSDLNGPQRWIITTLMRFARRYKSWRQSYRAQHV